MTRKEMAIKLAEIVKERNNLTISVNALANRYLNGAGYMKAYSKADFEKALSSFER